MTSYTIDLSSILTLNTDQFEQLCQANPDVKFERASTGELIIMSPTGGETGMNNATLIARFVVWNEQHNLGKVFDSSTCFRLPNGGERSPDIAWVKQSRWDALTPEQKQKFPPICPDFVLELRSPSDRLKSIQTKMQEYLDSGAKLGWLLNPKDKQTEIYRPGQTVEILQAPATLSGELVLPHFSLNVTWLWD
ncbi:MAG: Uma2 family endonuclease [Merismopedia sp. SIO2A8]|nr:Uma2 family endonuclease [Symploca sp. SIO2B6]NET53374.1 Uma2 family endonuclease [Merismopedia sp. SIO2A8]